MLGDSDDTSPMPFGVRPFRDLPTRATSHPSRSVSNAFRRSPLSGPSYSGDFASFTVCLQCLSAFAPFGTLVIVLALASSKGCLQCLSAFAPFGTRRGSHPGSAYAHCLQCLSAFAPFGTASWGEMQPGNDNQSPMPFGVRPFRDTIDKRAAWGNTAGLQCLSAFAPFGTQCRADQCRRHRRRLQCLSAFTPFGTFLPETQIIADCLVSNAFRRSPLSGLGVEHTNKGVVCQESPMPFGVRPFRDWRGCDGSFAHQLRRLQCLSAFAPFGTPPL